METETSAPQSIPLDPEHNGIRIALPLISIGSFFAFLIFLSPLINAVLPNGGNECLIAVCAGLGALGTMALADNLLKRAWPSGRSLTLDHGMLTFVDKRPNTATTLSFVLSERINWLTWRFTVKRGSARVARGWVMLGCQLVQDETQITLYTFAPAKEADHPRYQPFTQLVLPNILEKSNLPLREVAQHRRLLKAERERWERGAEMRREDFAALIERLQQQSAAPEA